MNEVKLLFLCCVWTRVNLNLCVEVEKVEAQGKTSIIYFCFTLASVCQIPPVLHLQPELSVGSETVNSTAANCHQDLEPV